MEAGTLTLTLENISGRFDPYNASSPLYPNVKPGRRMYISAQDLATGTIYPRFCGFVTDIQPVSGENKVIITCADGIQWLMDQEITIPTSYFTTISAAISAVLSTAQFPFVSAIQTWAQPIVVFDPDKVKAYDVLADLANGSLGTFFVMASGGAAYYPLNYAGMTTYALGQAVLLKEIGVQQPWETVRNVIKVFARRRAKKSITILWTDANMGIYMAAGATKVMTIEYKDAMNIAQPMPTTDYLAFTGNNTGTNVSAQFSVVLSNITPSSSTATITNNSAAGAYFEWLQIIGQEFVESETSFTSEDATSKGNGPNGYGPRLFTLQNDWLQDQGYAAAFAPLLLAFLKDPQKNPTIQIEQRPDIQFSPDLMDKVTLTSAKLSISATYQVGGIEERWNNENGQSVTTVLHLQTVVFSSAAITADPFYVGADPIPEVGTGPGDYIGGSPYGGSLPGYTLPGYSLPDPGGPNLPVDPLIIPPQKCTTDMAAPPNGPFILPFPAGFYYPGGVAGAGFPCMLRSSAAVNKSNMFIDGYYQKYVDGAWVDDDDNTWWSIMARLEGGPGLVYAGRPDSGGANPGLRGGDLLVGSAQDAGGFRIQLEGGAGDAILQFASKGVSKYGSPTGGLELDYQGDGIFECRADPYVSTFSDNFAMKLTYSGANLPPGRLGAIVENLDGDSIDEWDGSHGYHCGIGQWNDADIAHTTAGTYGLWGSLYHWGNTGGQNGPHALLSTVNRLCGTAWDAGTFEDRYVLLNFSFNHIISTMHFRLNSLYWWDGSTSYTLWSYSGAHNQYTKRIYVNSIQVNNVCNHSGGTLA